MSSLKAIGSTFAAAVSAPSGCRIHGSFELDPEESAEVTDGEACRLILWVGSVEMIAKRWWQLGSVACHADGLHVDGFGVANPLGVDTDRPIARFSGRCGSEFLQDRTHPRLRRVRLVS